MSDLKKKVEDKILSVLSDDTADNINYLSVLTGLLDAATRAEHKPVSPLFASEIMAKEQREASGG